MQKVFIDGATGTTALHIRSLVKAWEKANRISIISIPNHKDMQQRQSAFNDADISILCLPDSAARDAMKLINKTNTRVIDASSAHRIEAPWVYGLPELNQKQAAKIEKARFVTNPGCYATGAISILKPLIDQNLISPNDTHHIYGVAGYSAGGKSLIEKHENAAQDFSLANSFGAYSLNAPHKHVKEIKKHAGLAETPIFMPNVTNVPRGMIVSIAFNQASLAHSIQDVHQALTAHYNQIPNSRVNVMPLDTNLKRLNFDRFISVNTGNGLPLDNVQLYVSGWEDENNQQITIHTLLDNLGKGAASQAIQNLDLMLQ